MRGMKVDNADSGREEENATSSGMLEVRYMLDRGFFQRISPFPFFLK